MFRLIKLILWITIISGAVLWWNYSEFQKQELCIDFAEDGYYTVEKGTTFRSVLSEFYDSELFVKLYLRGNPPDFELQAGKYAIECGNIETIINSLKKAINEDEQITILEGWNIYDIDKELVKKGLIQAGEYVNYTMDCEGFCEQKYDFALIADAETLEGFLYPDTYAINPNNFEIKNLVARQLQNFQKKVIDSGIITDMGSIEILDVINMASIVQKEANKRDNPEELALIAGILKKRAAEGWQIGADATVCYAHEIATEDCTPAKVLEYLYDKNEYNTRQMIGLPRGPIANPEAEVIEATLNSKDSPYYYYLHDTTGQIHYGVTNADHEANKAKYLN